MYVYRPGSVVTAEKEHQPKADFENIQRLTLNARQRVVPNIHSPSDWPGKCDFHTSSVIHSKFRPDVGYSGAFRDDRSDSDRRVRPNRGRGYLNHEVLVQDDGFHSRINKVRRVTERGFGSQHPFADARSNSDQTKVLRIEECWHVGNTLSQCDLPLTLHTTEDCQIAGKTCCRRKNESKRDKTANFFHGQKSIIVWVRGTSSDW